MSRIELSRQVDAPSNAVWGVMVALDDSPETIFGRLFAGPTKKMIRRDLDDIALAAESRPD